MAIPLVILTIGWAGRIAQDAILLGGRAAGRALAQVPYALGVGVRYGIRGSGYGARVGWKGIRAAPMTIRGTGAAMRELTGTNRTGPNYGGPAVDEVHQRLSGQGHAFLGGAATGQLRRDPADLAALDRLVDERVQGARPEIARAVRDALFRAAHRIRHNDAFRTDPGSIETILDNEIRRAGHEAQARLN